MSTYIDIEISDIRLKGGVISPDFLSRDATELKEKNDCNYYIHKFSEAKFLAKISLLSPPLLRKNSKGEIACKIPTPNFVLPQHCSSLIINGWARRIVGAAPNLHSVSQ